MQVITIKEFESDVDKYITAAANGDEVYSIGLGKRKAVLIEQAEYLMLVDAMATLLSQNK